MSTIQTLNLREFMTRHLTDVFETMLATKAVPVERPELPQFAERVTGSVAFAGEQVTGAVYLHLSAPFAIQAAAAMLGMGPGDPVGESEVNDVVGEMTNGRAGPQDTVRRKSRIRPAPCRSLTSTRAGFGRCSRTCSRTPRSTPGKGRRS